MKREKGRERSSKGPVEVFVCVGAAGRFVFFSSFDDRGIRGWFLVILDYMF